MTVGWLRRVSLFADPAGDHLTVGLPANEAWDQTRGHHEDILAVAYSEPNTLASASYDGEILVWNLASGSLTRRLGPVMSGRPDSLPRVASAPLVPPPPPAQASAAVHALVFLRSRAGIRDSASLVAIGDAGIALWNIWGSGVLWGRFQTSETAGVVAKTAATTSDERHLVTGDTEGFVVVWDLQTYCVGKAAHDTAPPQVCHLKQTDVCVCVYVQAVLFRGEVVCLRAAER